MTQISSDAHWHIAVVSIRLSTPPESNVIPGIGHARPHIARGTDSILGARSPKNSAWQENGAVAWRGP
jgi:hypothetical protein